MITARYNTFGSWFFFILTPLFFLFVLMHIFNHYSVIRIDFFKKTDNRGYYASTFIFSFITLLYLSFIYAFIKKITIDPTEKTITFKNIITRQTKRYEFADLDGIADTYLNHRYGNYRTVGLVKDKKVIRYIDSFWISNYDELRESLQDLKCFGTFNFGTWKQLKLLLRLPVID